MTSERLRLRVAQHSCRRAAIPFAAAGGSLLAASARKEIGLAPPPVEASRSASGTRQRLRGDLGVPPRRRRPPAILTVTRKNGRKCWQPPSKFRGCPQKRPKLTGTPIGNDVRPFCWTDLTIRYMVMSSVLHRTHSVQFFLDSNFVVITQIFIKFFQKVLDRVELLQI